MLNKAASYFERAIKSNDYDGHTCFGAWFDSWLCQVTWTKLDWTPLPMLA